jgi:hypothetical protein
VVVTYKDDLPQFEVMLHCLNRFWSGDKNITICCTDSNDAVQEITKTILSSGWNIHFYPSLDLICGGYYQQQIYKIKATIDSKFDDSIVFDSKDFLLKTASQEDFKNLSKNKYAQFFDSTKTFIDIYPTVKDLDIPLDGLPLPLILTPWIWNKNQLSCYWEYLNNKFGNYTTWQIIPTGSEWAGYFAYLFNNDPDSIDSLTPYWMPIGGVWKGQSLSQIEEQLAQFDLYTDRKIWKHHRAVTDTSSVKITALALSTHGIADSTIDHWTSHYILR